MSGRCLVGVWKLYKMCLEVVWKVSEMVWEFLSSICEVLGRYFELFGKYPEKVRKVAGV